MGWVITRKWSGYTFALGAGILPAMSRTSAVTLMRDRGEVLGVIDHADAPEHLSPIAAELWADLVADADALRAALPTPPLAVLPRQAWDALCMAAGLFRLDVASDGTIPIDDDAFEGFSTPGRGFRAAHKLNLEHYAATDWPGMLLRMMPGYRTVSPRDTWLRAHVVLPQPPPEVVATLLAASAAGLHLLTAAVPDAIQFRETITDMRDRITALRAAEAARIAADPIVYTEHGSATAILAQFGDFPVEREILDAVCATDNLLSSAPYTDAAEDRFSRVQQFRMSNQERTIFDAGGGGIKWM